MKILYIAPLPPPVTGHSLVSDVLRKHLDLRHNVLAIDCKKEDSKEGVSSFKRILEVLSIFKKIWMNKKKSEIIYLTISESFAGNLKDLFIYLICINYLPNFFIHLHGGSIKKQLWDKMPFIFWINKLFIRRMAGVLISGQSHREIFDGFVNDEKLHIVPNFAEDMFFVSKSDIINKFNNFSVLKVLYLSSLRRKKGYLDLLDAFFILDDNVKRKVQFDFAGAFETEDQKRKFFDKTKDFKQIKYHGIVSNEEKKTLLEEAHIFCLPTKYFEGQPISILEAYASGCVVITTGKGGIVDIFDNKLNGQKFEENSPESIMKVVGKALKRRESLTAIAVNNNEKANEKYKEVIYCSSIQRIFEEHSNNYKNISA